MSRPSEVFLSHATADRAFADRLAKILRAHGVPVWYSRTELRGGQQWHDEIGLALARCDAFVIVLSPASLGSEWVKTELLYALDDPRYRRRIIPVMLEKCEYKRVYWALVALQQIDFSRDFDSGCGELFRVWGVGYQPEKAKASTATKSRATRLKKKKMKKKE
jgi:hypothetical protein